MTAQKPSYDYLVKILLIGNSCVGKSSILLRYTDHMFTPSFISTIGIDFKIKTIDLDGKKFKLQIWDTAGQERFRTITTAYYRGAMGILIVYDISDMKSFEDTKNWMNNIANYAEKNVNMILVGNKCDKDDRAISYEMGKALADKLGIKFMETSARTNKNVDEVFVEIIRDISKQLIKSEDMQYITSTSSTPITLNEEQNKSKSCCR